MAEAISQRAGQVLAASLRRRLCVSKMFPGIMQKIPLETDMMSNSQKLMLYYGIIQQSHIPGTYHLLPMALRSLEKLTRLIDNEMHSIGAQKIAMPCLTSGNLWKKSGRWESTGPELFKLKDRHDVDQCLGPTHEEAVTTMFASDDKFSYRKLPLRLYQITRKFRDEMHPKFGLLRGKEFEMKDMYTFDMTEELARETYNEVCSAYDRLFDTLQLRFVKVKGTTGNIGGTLSHEYHLPCSIGEDTLLICDRCGVGNNKELLTESASNHETDTLSCACGGQFVESKGIEVGHSFLLGTKYSSTFKARYSSENGKPELVQMGCYGLGVTRILGAAVEVLSTEDQICWPGLIAPYQICIIPQKAGYKADITLELSERIYDLLTSIPNLRSEVVLDDRIKLSIGRRLYEAKKLGYPYIVILGKEALTDKPLFELMDVKKDTSEYFTEETLCHKLLSVETV